MRLFDPTTRVTLFSEPLLQAQAQGFRWTYIWLVLGGIVFALTVLAFVYLLVRRRQEWMAQYLPLPLFVQMDRLLSRYFPRLGAFIRQRFTVQQWHGLALTVASVVFFVALYLFTLIIEAWTEEEALYAFDQRIYGWLIDSLNAQMITFMQGITRFGDGLMVTLISLALGIILWLYHHRWQVVALLLAVGLGSGLNWGLKWLFERSRPGEQLAAAAGHSFPSGHAFWATTLYGFMIYLTWRFTQNDGIRIAITILLTFLILLVGLSRVILRVHWVSDVAGGFTVGLAWLVCSLIITRSLQAYHSRSGHRHTGIEEHTQTQ